VAFTEAFVPTTVLSTWNLSKLPTDQLAAADSAA